MPELGDDRVGIGFFHHPRHQAEVIILNEHEGRSISGFRRDRLSKLFVDLTIDRPVPGIEDGPGEHHMAQRPQALVGQAVVKPLHLFLGKP
jgi:hypothetical protein